MQINNNIHNYFSFDNKLWQHRIMRQGDSAEDFNPSESMENAGILDVPIFHTARSGQKIRGSHCAVLPYILFACCSASVTSGYSTPLQFQIAHPMPGGQSCSEQFFVHLGAGRGLNKQKTRRSTEDESRMRDLC